MLSTLLSHAQLSLFHEQKELSMELRSEMTSKGDSFLLFINRLNLEKYRLSLNTLELMTLVSCSRVADFLSDTVFAKLSSNES